MKHFAAKHFAARHFASKYISAGLVVSLIWAYPGEGAAAFLIVPEVEAVVVTLSAVAVVDALEALATLASVSGASIAVSLVLETEAVVAVNPFIEAEVVS